MGDDSGPPVVTLWGIFSDVFVTRPMIGGEVHCIVCVRLKFWVYWQFSGGGIVANLLCVIMVALLLDSLLHAVYLIAAEVISVAA